MPPPRRHPEAGGVHVADLTAVIGFYPDLKPLQRHTGVGLRIGVTINGARSDDFRPSPGWLFSGRA